MVMAHSYDEWKRKGYGYHYNDEYEFYSSRRMTSAADIYSRRKGEDRRTHEKRLFKDGHFIGDYWYDDEGKKWVWNYEHPKPKYVWNGAWKDGKVPKPYKQRLGAGGGVDSVTLSSWGNNTIATTSNIVWATDISNETSGLAYHYNDSMGVVSAVNNRTGEVVIPDLSESKLPPLEWLDRVIQKTCDKALT